MNFISRIIKGAKWSEKYGEHPGTFWLIVFVLMGATAGFQTSDIIKSIIGMTVMLCTFGPIWLFGCWNRGD